MTCQLLLPLFSLHPMKQRTFGVQASASFSACPKLVICCCNFVKMQENSGWFHHQHLPAGSTRTLLCGNCHAEMNRFFSEEHCVLFCGAKGILLSLVMQDKSWFFFHWELGLQGWGRHPCDEMAEQNSCKPKSGLKRYLSTEADQNWGPHSVSSAYQHGSRIHTQGYLRLICFFFTLWLEDICGPNEVMTGRRWFSSDL